MNNWLYAGTCLVVPALWSLVLHRIFQYIEKRQRRFEPDTKPPVDYSI